MMKKGKNELAAKNVVKGYKRLMKDYVAYMGIDIFSLTDMEKNEYKLIKTSLDVLNDCFDYMSEQAKTLDSLESKIDLILKKIDNE